MKSALFATAVRLVTGATVRWVGCQPDVRQRIYFANHTSNLDALVLWAALPAAVRTLTRPVAARDYWMAGPMRRCVAEKIFHAVLIERKKVTAHDNPIDQMLQASGDRYSLIIFPEGGRNPGPEVGPFKSGLYHLGKKRPDFDLIPVYIDNLNRILPKGEVLPVPLLSSISFGAPIRVEANEDKHAFMERARKAVTELQHL